MTTTVHRLGVLTQGSRLHLDGLRRELAERSRSVIELLMRIGIALVFWKSGLTKIANWDLTVALFAEEYRVPLLAPELAAYLGTATELAASVLLIVGLGSRLAALSLLGLVGVIQIFVYPENWSEHLLWVSLLLYVVTQGPGRLAVDHLIARRWL